MCPMIIVELTVFSSFFFWTMGNSHPFFLPCWFNTSTAWISPFPFFFFWFHNSWDGLEAEKLFPPPPPPLFTKGCVRTPGELVSFPPPCLHWGLNTSFLKFLLLFLHCLPYKNVYVYLPTSFPFPPFSPPSRCDCNRPSPFSSHQQFQFWFLFPFPPLPLPPFIWS